MTSWRKRSSATSPASLPRGPTALPRSRQPAHRWPATPGLALFDDQATSRHLDLAARWLRSKGRGFYTIGSSGHEANAAVASALRPTDPALLHYRSGGFYMARARQVPGHDPVADVLRGMLASSDEPMAGGRHKVFGHPDLAIIPQTSTIASHLPRALGVAFAIGRARKLDAPISWPADALVVCSFGDASANHSTATGAINTAVRVAYQHLPLPLLLVCEDNGIGISVRTPQGWIEAAYGHRPHLRYEQVDGTDPAEVVRRHGSAGRLDPGRAAAGVPPPGAPCASAGTPAPTWRRPTGRPRRCVGTTVATRCSAPLASSWVPAWRRRRSWSSATSASVPSVRAPGRGAARRTRR